MGSLSAGLSRRASSSSSRKGDFIAVRKSGRRSCTPEIETTRATRPTDARGQRGIPADHARDDLTACGMAGEDDRPFDEAGGGCNRLADFGDDFCDARLGAETIGRDHDSVAPRQRPSRQMRPHRAVVAQPVAAVHEDDETPRRRLGQEKIEHLPRRLAIDDGASLQLVRMAGAERRRRSRHLSTQNSPPTMWAPLA